MSSAESQKGGFDEWAQELLTELEQQTPEAIKRMRSSERHEVQSAVKIRPANASDFLMSASDASRCTPSTWYGSR